MTLGWPLATCFMLLVAASMGELCSAIPTSGAMYHWALALGTPWWAWFAAWCNLVGLMSALAGINYSCAQFILPFLGLPATPLQLFLMFAFITVNQALLNHYGLALVAKLNDLSVAVHIIGVLAITGAILLWARLAPAAFLLEGVNSNGRSPYWWAFLLGLLQAQWTYTGFDASAHMAEETEDPRRRAPWGIVLSVGVSGAAGYVLLLALTLSIGDMGAVLSAKDAGGNPVPAAIAVMQQALNPGYGAAMGALASMAMWFCGLGCIASASRTLYSLARDGGTPAANLLRGVNAGHGTPGAAIWGIAIASILLMIWTGAIPVITSLSTISIYVAYGIPIVLAVRARSHGVNWSRLAVWSLGRWGRLVNLVSIGYTIFICVVLVMPPNQFAGVTFAGVSAGLYLLWRLRVRRQFEAAEGGRFRSAIQQEIAET
jgi:amino acid transporter